MEATPGGCHRFIRLVKPKHHVSLGNRLTRSRLQSQRSKAIFHTGHGFGLVIDEHHRRRFRHIFRIAHATHLSRFTATLTPSPATVSTATLTGSASSSTITPAFIPSSTAIL